MENEHSAIPRLKMLMDVGYRIDQKRNTKVLGAIRLEHPLRDRATWPSLILHAGGLVESASITSKNKHLLIESSDTDSFWQLIQDTPVTSALDKMEESFLTSVPYIALGVVCFGGLILFVKVLESIIIKSVI